jgi:hypothetical protein
MEAAGSPSPIIRYCVHGGVARTAQESTSITALWGEGRLEGGHLFSIADAAGVHVAAGF